ncbi:MAG: hypothetical protein V7L29_17650 [Nostoc sp.]
MRYLWRAAPTLTNTERITATYPFWRSLHPKLFINAIAMVLTLI